MILTKINIDEIKLAETDITRSVFAMLPPELKDLVKDHAPAVYNPPIKTQVSLDVSQILGVSETEKDPFFLSEIRSRIILPSIVQKRSELVC